MSRIQGGLCLLFAIILFRSQAQQSPKSISHRLYREAERLFYLPEPTEAQDSMAIAKYLSVIRLHDGKADSIFRDAHYKVAIYLQTFGKFNEAIPYLKETIRLYPLAGNLPDSLQYLPFLYLGNSYYAGDRLDSAFDAYKQAENIALKYKHINGLERLYNTLGVMHFEAGNYQQSAVYFDKALSTLTDERSNNQFLFVNYSNNYASALRKSGQWNKAIGIYKELLKYNYNNDELLNNIGSTFLENEQDSLALAYLSKIKKDSPEKLNDLAIANIHLKRPDIAMPLLDKAIALNKSGKMYKSIRLGTSWKLKADIYSLRDQADSSLSYYQLALQQLIFSFNDSNVRVNPSEFQGQYYVSELFETLAAKAHAFVLRYKTGMDIADLESCIDTYRSIYAFTDYITRIYDRDEARLALGNRKHLSHDEPLEACVILYNKTKNRKYLELAFSFDEKNKASVLSIQAQQNRIKRNIDLPRNLLNEESRLKQSLASLLLKLHTASDSSAATELQNKIRDVYIQFERVQAQLDKYDAYKKSRFIDNTKTLREFQQLVPKDYMVLSYHYSDDRLIRFVITRDSADMQSLPVPGSLGQTIRTLRTQLAQPEQNFNSLISASSARLYHLLLAGLDDDLKSYRQLMIIPDDELSLLPFELLQAPGGNMLIDEHTLTYNYSCTVISEFSGMTKQANAQVLSFAPFADAG